MEAYARGEVDVIMETQRYDEDTRRLDADHLSTSYVQEASVGFLSLVFVVDMRLSVMVRTYVSVAESLEDAKKKLWNARGEVKV